MNADRLIHSLPLLLMAFLVVLGIAALAILYRRKRQLRGAVEERFRAFRAQAMALMDQLDGLRRRHGSLPATDPDFTEPMSGATLALYNAVETELSDLWERWLDVMDLWDRAQRLIRSGSGLSVGTVEEARRLLDEARVDELLRRSASCKDRLDRLNRGHEQAREALAMGRSELAASRASVDRGTGVVLPSDPRSGEMIKAESLFERADGMLTSDPIGAEEQILRARRILEDVDHPGGGEAKRIRSNRPSYSMLDDLTAAAERFREAVAKLGLTNLLTLFAKFWMLVWGISLLIGILNLLLPLVILALGFMLIFAGFSTIWVVVALGLWYALWRARR